MLSTFQKVVVDFNEVLHANVQFTKSALLVHAGVLYMEKILKFSARSPNGVKRSTSINYNKK